MTAVLSQWFNYNNVVLKQKLKREHHLKGTLQKQSNKHQNLQKAMLKAENIKLPVACLRQLFCLILRLISYNLQGQNDIYYND